MRKICFLFLARWIGLVEKASCDGLGVSSCLTSPCCLRMDCVSSCWLLRAALSIIKLLRIDRYFGRRRKGACFVFNLQEVNLFDVYILMQR